MSLLAAGSVVGKYTILGRLATGGMSEIYLARQTGLRGFSKVVVLKLILPHLADSPSFMNMFINEAKLAAVLNHPNVIQIFDFGEEQGRAYIAMEYVDGRNLNRICRALHDQGERIPLAVALRIISDTCSALTYAHELGDGAGNPLHIVHRDVSRENILVTYAGQVKLVDFGIAKAAFIEGQTTEGSLKGKFAYMAPEMVRGLEIDQRVDIYALGVTLYAALLGRLPFKAENHADLLEQIVNRTPATPRSLDPALPEEVERIVLRAMDKDRELRYQSAAELHRDLESYLGAHQAAVMPYQLAAFMSRVFPPGSDKDREIYQSLTTTTPATRSPPIAPRATLPTGVIKLPRPDATGPQPEVQPPARFRGWLLAALLLTVFAGGMLVTALLATRSAPPVELAPTAAPAGAAEAGPRRQTSSSRADATPAASIPPPADAGRSAPPPPRPSPAPRQPGYLSLTAPGPGEVLLGKKLLGQLPLEKVPLAPGRHQLQIRSRQRGYLLARAVLVVGGKHQAVNITPGEGRLRILVDPWAKVTLDGKLLGITPLQPITVPEGSHELLFENSELKVKRRKTVQVRAGEIAEVRLTLE